MLKQEKTLLLRGVMMLIAFIAASKPLYARDNEAQPPKPQLVLQAQWGEDESAEVPIGLANDQGWYTSFEHFAVRGKQMFIADSIFGRIALFENNKLIHSYPLPTAFELGLAVHGNDLYELDRSGYLLKMDLDTLKVITSSKPVIVEEHSGITGIVTEGLYTLYSLGEQLVINEKHGEKDICVSMQSLEITTCVGMPEIYLSKNSGETVVVDGKKFITKRKEYAILHDSSGAVIARAYWPDSKLIYPNSAWLYTKEGLYYTVPEGKVVRIFFQPWQKTENQ